MLGAIKFGHETIRRQCELLLSLQSELGKDTKRTYSHEVHDEALRDTIMSNLREKVKAVAYGGTAKQERSDAFKAIITEYIETMSEEERAEKEGLAKRYYHDLEWEVMREMILADHKRLDGRALDQIRPIWTEVDYLPSVHGSAVFTRGETQSLTSVTLGTKLDSQLIDGVVFEGESKFLLHYNFLPYSTGEARPLRGTGRREIGHGNLALPCIEEYAARRESLYHSCSIRDPGIQRVFFHGHCLCRKAALMDAGVQMKKPVAGIAMGLISDPGMTRYAVLSDILGDEDHLGDMDFKVTGTADGITATQMDIKVDGLNYEVLEKALDQARNGRLHIPGRDGQDHHCTEGRLQAWYRELRR